MGIHPIISIQRGSKQYGYSLQYCLVVFLKHPTHIFISTALPQSSAPHSRFNSHSSISSRSSPSWHLRLVAPNFIFLFCVRDAIVPHIPVYAALHPLSTARASYGTQNTEKNVHTHKYVTHAVMKVSLLLSLRILLCREPLCTYDRYD